ncbi:MAG: hypothetical protein ACD_62C00052G0001, partial [uncultured bacterium]
MEGGVSVKAQAEMFLEESPQEKGAVDAAVALLNSFKTRGYFVNPDVIFHGETTQITEDMINQTALPSGTLPKEIANAAQDALDTLYALCAPEEPTPIQYTESEQIPPSLFDKYPFMRDWREGHDNPQEGQLSHTQRAIVDIILQSEKQGTTEAMVIKNKLDAALPYDLLTDDQVLSYLRGETTLYTAVAQAY